MSPGPIGPSGEPIEGMFNQQPLPEPAPPSFNLPPGMFYGVDQGWMGGPVGGESARPPGSAAFYAPGQPTESFIAANMGRPPQDFSSLAYTQDTWNPQTAAAASPGFFRDRNGGLYTDNWQLLGRGPGWIMRGGLPINAMTPQAKQGLPYGADPSFSDTAESGTANYQRRVSPGGALTGRNKYDAYYWPGGVPWGYTRWPYQTDV